MNNSYRIEWVSLLVMVLGTVSPIAWAQSEVGHGGKVIVCPGKPIVTLDYYDIAMQTIGGRSSIEPISGLTEAEVVSMVVSKLKDTVFQKKLVRILKKIGPSQIWKAAPLHDVPDADLPYPIPSQCKKVQAAVRYGDVVVADPKILSKMSPEQKGMLVLHEALYFIGVEAGHITSNAVRPVLKALMTKTVTLAEAIDAVDRLGGILYRWQTLGMRGFKLAATAADYRAASNAPFRGFLTNGCKLSVLGVDPATARVKVTFASQGDNPLPCQYFVHNGPMIGNCALAAEGSVCKLVSLEGKELFIGMDEPDLNTDIRTRVPTPMGVHETRMVSEVSGQYAYFY